jgi:hypothetical protein
VWLEVKTNLRCDPAIAGAETTATATSAAGPKTAEPTIKRKALAKKRRGQIADWRTKIHAIEQVLEVQRKLHAVTFCFSAATAYWTTNTG